MQENRFEKGVKDQMEDFQLRPSATVWDRVEKEIVRKKRRRTVLVAFLIVGLALLGYTGYEFYTSPVPVLAYKSRKAQSSESANPSGKPNILSSEQDQHQQAISSEKPDSSWRSGKPASEDLNKPGPKEVTSTNVTLRQDKTGKKTGRNTPPPVKPHDEVNAPGKTIRDRPTVVKTDITQVNNSRSNSASPVNNETRRILKPSRRYSDIILTTGSPRISTDDISRQLRSLRLHGKSSWDSLALAVGKEKSRRPIRWGFELSIGKSNRRDQALPTVFGNKKEQNPLLSSGIITGVPPGNYPLTPPSPVKPGLAFRAGVMAAIPLGKRTSLLTGVNYAYQSDRIHAGVSRDTNFIVNNAISQTYLVSAVYAAKAEKSKTNKYHLVQVPIRFQYIFGENKKLPVSWDLGVNLGYLFASNALIYDTVAHGVYYRDEKAFQRFHIAVASGVHLQMGKPGKMNWSLGPEVTMDMNRLVKNVYDRKQYPFYVGLSARIFLPVKKI